MPWQPLPRIAFAVATYPFSASSPADLPLEIGDELYMIEQTPDGHWLRGYLVAPPSLLAGLTSVKGQTLEARVFSGIFPRSCVEVREVLGEGEATDEEEDSPVEGEGEGEGDLHRAGSDSAKSGLTGKKRRKERPRPEISVGRWGNLSPTQLSHGSSTRPPAPVPMLKIGDETPTSAAEPLVDEIASCLREWHSTNLHELLLTRQYGKLDRLSQLITALNFSRQQFLHGVLTTWEYGRLREKTVWDLVRVNKLCGGEVIVRDPRERGRVLTGDDSVVEITQLQSAMSLLDEPPSHAAEATALHHLLVDVRSFAGTSAEPTTVVLYLASKRPGRPPVALSESYVVEVPAGHHLSRGLQMRTLFTDLAAADVGDSPSAESELFLVVKIRTAHHIVAAAKPSSRSGSLSHGMPFAGAPNGHRDASKPPLTAGNRSVRRSLMWAQKSTRSAFSRGGSGGSSSGPPKLDALSEQPEPARPATEGVPDSRDEGVPPSTAGSRAQRSSMDSPSSPSSATADKTVGIGVLRLNAVMKQEEEVEQVVNVWAPAWRWGGEGAEECDGVVRELAGSRTGQYDRARRAERLQIQLRPFRHADAEALIKATPTALAGVGKTHKMGFSGAPTRARSDIYVTVDEAVLSRQTLLSRAGGSPTPLPAAVRHDGGGGGGNLQVSLEVRRAGGERVESCLYASSNAGPEGLSVWRSVATSRGDPWRQTVRLSLAPQDVYGSHVVMRVADVPGAPFAAAHIPLWDQQAFVRDGTHALLLYREPGEGEQDLTALPWTARGRDEVTGPLAVLHAQTFLCSTRFSQDRVVLGLLRWKEGAAADIPELLRQLVFVAEVEVVKLLSDVLDALFGILVEHAGSDEHEDLVFTALVRVLGIVHDRRFDVAPLVDQYAESRFNYPFATPCLVRSFTRLLARPTEPDTARKLRATFKVVRHVLKFITHARGQQRQKEAGIGLAAASPGFTRHLRSIFKALDAMMRSDAPVLVGSQTLAVQHFHTWLPELAGLLTAEEILHVAIDFVDSCSAVKGRLVLYKLVLIIHYARLDIFSHPEQRAALSANTARWIAPHWGAVDEVTPQWRDQVRLCCSVLASQADHLGAEIPDYIPKIIGSYLSILRANEETPPPRPKTEEPRLSLLFPTSYPFPSRPAASDPVDEALVELSAVLSALSGSPGGMQLELADDDLGAVVDGTLRVHMSILQGDAFPASWLSVHIFHHKSTMRALQYLAGLLLDSFLPDPDDAESFHTDLWKLFFSALLRLVGSSSLALETFPEQKRRAVWKIAGDVREHGAELLRRTWEAIGWETSAEERARFGLARMGGYQVQYVPALVGPIVELCLSVHEGLRRVAVEVLQSMVVSEWTLSEDLAAVQAELIDCLDAHFKSKPLTESILQKLFVAELLARFAPLAAADPRDPLLAAVQGLVATVDEFLDLLVAVHGGDGTTSSETSSSSASHVHRLRLMEFLRDVQKEDIFVRYVHQLAALQAADGHHAEAGLALRLHADLYDWDPARQLPALADPCLPAQSHFDRRERLYFDMIRHFEDARAWACALDAYKELRAQYEANVFDLSKLARTERAMAAVYDAISSSSREDRRLVPRYFKVLYRGLGFPPSLRDKEFVFEGAPAETSSSAFADRLQEQYPAAQIVAADHVDDVEGQFLIVSSLSPHRDLGHPVFQRARVPPTIRDYLLASRPQSFAVTSRRVTTGPVTDHYADKVVYTTAEPFPTILRRSEIVERRDVRLSAKETALERIARKTADMTALEKRLAEGDDGDEAAQLLVDAVSISLNPQSENSVVCYRRLVPGNNDEEEDGDDEDDEEEDDDDSSQSDGPPLDDQESAIKMALVDHAIMIKRCLAAFSRSQNPVLSKNAPELQRYFDVVFAPEIAAFSPPQPLREPTLAQAPSWPRSPPPAPTPVPKQHARTPSSKSAKHAEGVVVSTDEVVVRPVSLHRGARLSFLGGRKKELQHQPPLPPITPEDQYHHSPSHSPPSHPAPSLPPSHAPPPLPTSSHRHKKSNSDSKSTSSRGRSNGRSLQNAKDNRRSFFRPLPDAKQPAVVHVNGADSNTSDWATATEASVAAAGQLEGEKTGGEHGPGHGGLTGNVKKRLSILKLGKKSSKGSGLMGSVDEE